MTGFFFNTRLELLNWIRVCRIVLKLLQYPNVIFLSLLLVIVFLLFLLVCSFNGDEEAATAGGSTASVVFLLFSS